MTTTFSPSSSSSSSSSSSYSSVVVVFILFQPSSSYSASSVSIYDSASVGFDADHLELDIRVVGVIRVLYQVPSQLNIKEGKELNCQRNFQLPIQVPHQLILQIDSNRNPSVFTRDMPHIMPVSPGFRYSNGNLSGSPSDKLTNDPFLVLMTNPSSKPSKNQTKYLSRVTK